VQLIGEKYLVAISVMIFVASSEPVKPYPKGLVDPSSLSNARMCLLASKA
jgi:hypothetical protein